MKLRPWMLGWTVSLTLVGGAAAADRYESAIGAGTGDNDAGTSVELLHGRLRAHDLEAGATPDEDWSFVQETVGHSYEVTVMNTPLRWQSAPTAGYVTMNRVDDAGAILTAGQPLNVYRGAFAVRWIVTSSPAGYTFVRVVGLPNLGTTAVYEIQMRDTTYSVPRWNNSATQVTVFVIANTKGEAVSGDIYFYDAGGALLTTQAFSVPAFGLHVVNTASIPALAGLSGSAQIAHLGGYGALSGKAVALEPSTGFTFDTAMTPIPH